MAGKVFRRFYNAKIISQSGTLFRSEDKSAEGEEIYRYSLSRAMDKKGILRGLCREEAQPQRIWFTHEDPDEELTLEQVFEMKEQAWFFREE